MKTFFLVSPRNIGHETLNEILDILQKRIDPLATLSHVSRELSCSNTTPILMSRSNPDGIPLEDIIDQIISDMKEKRDYIDNDRSLASQTIKNNNRDIVDLLLRIKRINEETRNLLEAIEPDPGPSGKPRVGKY